MQKDHNEPSKTIEFFIESKNTEVNAQNIDTAVMGVEGVRSVDVNPSSGQVKVIVQDGPQFDQKFIEIQRAIFKLGYEINVKNTNTVQGVLFFGTMILGFLFVAVVIALFYYFGSLPSLI